MTEKPTDFSADLVRKLDEIAAIAGEMKAAALQGKSELVTDAKELDRKIRELKALLGMSAFDKTAYQRDYMRKKRAEDPDYRPIMEPVRDLPDWRKPPANRK